MNCFVSSLALTPMVLLAALAAAVPGSARATVSNTFDGTSAAWGDVELRGDRTIAGHGVSRSLLSWTSPIADRVLGHRDHPDTLFPAGPDLMIEAGFSDEVLPSVSSPPANRGFLPDPGAVLLVALGFAILSIRRVRSACPVPIRRSE